MVDDEGLESAGDFKPYHLGYINHIFENTSDSRFRLWDIQEYTEVTEFIKKLCVCEMDFISPEELITYETLVQEATFKYSNIINSNRWEPATVKEKSQDQPSLPRACTMAIENLADKDLKQVDFKSRHSGTVVDLEEDHMLSQM